MTTRTSLKIDPYRAYLHVKDTRRPLDAYRLLNLEPLEQDPEAIKAAAARQRAQLEVCRAQVDRHTWSQLASQLEDAIATLQQPSRKAQLDRSLRRQLGLPEETQVEMRGAAAITCGHCGAENATVRKFCSECGSSLRQPCSQCKAECGIDEKFCGSCGADLHSERLERAERLEQELQRALQYEQDYEFGAALQLLERLVASGEAQVLARAAAAAERTRQTRAEWEQRATEICAEAEQLARARAYGRAASLLETLPQPLRSRECQEQLERCRAKHVELKTCKAAIQQALNKRQWLHLATLLERLFALDPEDPQAIRLAEHVREKLLRAAQQKLEQHHYAKAQAILELIPSQVQRGKDAALRAQTAELAWLEQVLRTASVVDDSLSQAAERLRGHLSNDHPLSERIRALEKLRQQAPKQSHLAAVDWVPPPPKTFLGAPVDWLGSFRRVQLESSLRVRLAKHPGQFFVACGLALQALGLAHVPAQLMPKSSGGMLRKFTRRWSSDSSAWGIDLSPAGLKAVKLTRLSPTEVRCDECVYIAHEKSLAQPGLEAQRTEILTATLKKFGSRCELGKSAVAVNLPGDKLLGRLLQLPSARADRVASMVRHELPNHIPLPADELVWDHHALPLAEGSATPAQQAVLLLAARRSDVEQRLRVFEEAGIHVELMQSDCVALHNYALYDLVPDESSAKRPLIAILDVGASVTNVILSGKDHLWFRSIAAGGEDVTRALVSELNQTHAQAEALKREPTSAARAHLVGEVLEQQTAALAAEVQRTLASHHRQHPDRQVEHFYGVGGGFALHGLLRYLRHGK